MGRDRGLSKLVVSGTNAQLVTWEQSPDDPIRVHEAETNRAANNDRPRCWLCDGDDVMDNPTHACCRA